MKYFAIFTVALLAGAQVTAAADPKTCDDCKTDSATNLGKSDAKTKCAAAKKYITCLASTTNHAAGCDSPDVSKLKLITKTTCSAPGDALTPVCLCHKALWDEGGDCSKIETLALCLKSESGNGCDTTLNEKTTLDAEKKRCDKVSSTPGHSKAGSSTTASNSKAGARGAEASGLTTIILLSILGMFFM